MAALVGSGVIGSNLLEGGDDGRGVAASSSLKICATIISVMAPRVLKNIWKILVCPLSSSIIGGSVYSSSWPWSIVNVAQDTLTNDYITAPKMTTFMCPVSSSIRIFNLYLLFTLEKSVDICISFRYFLNTYSIYQIV